MKTFKTLVCTNYKLHKYLTVSGLFFLLLYSAYVTYFFLISDNDIGNSLQFSSFFIQAGMLFFMLLGFQFAKKNLNSILFEVVGKKNMRKINVINLLTLLLIIIVFVLLIFISYYLIFFNLDTDFKTSFTKETFLFLIHYWMLPFCIMGTIGYTVGINSNSKLSYILLVLLWAIVSPTNLYYFKEILNTAQIQNGVNWLENLNLGVNNISYPYEAFYGFEFNWTKRVSLFISMISIFFISLIVGSIRKLQLLNLILLVFIFFLFSLYPNGYTKNEIDEIDSIYQDYKYYLTEQSNPTISDELFEYQINKINLSVNNFKEFKVDATLDISIENKNRIALTLYQGFNVSKVSLDKNNLFFKQEGDYIIVSLPKYMKDRKQISLQISYSGNGSNFRPATPNYIYLPGDFGWVPNNNPSPTHFIFNEDDILPSSSKLNSKVKYKLTYKGKEELNYINLSRKSNSIYEGESTGVTLILGEITANVIDGKNVYFPKSWFLYDKEIKKYLKLYTLSLKIYNEIFKENYKLPDDIVLLPNMDMNNNYSYINSYGDNDHIILQMDPVSFSQKANLYDIIPFQVARAFSDDENYFKNSDKYASWFVYNTVLGSYMSINKELSLADSKNLSKIHLYFTETVGGFYNKPFYEQLYQLDLNTLSDHFFIQWKQLLQDNQKNDWLQLEQLYNQLKNNS